MQERYDYARDDPKEVRGLSEAAKAHREKHSLSGFMNG